MAWYQARRHLLDFVNCLDIEHGVYIETDCIKWVKRFGPDLRPLNPGEIPKPTFKKITVVNTVEDQVKEIKEEAKVEAERVKAEAKEVEKGMETIKRRKLKTAT